MFEVFVYWENTVGGRNTHKFTIKARDQLVVSAVGFSTKVEIYTSTQVDTDRKLVAEYCGPRVQYSLNRV